MLQGEVFAIAILHIKEIMEYGHLTTVPMMPDFISGVINLRGAVVPVVDLSARFGGNKTELTKRTCIVIIEVDVGDDSQVIGLIVDAVNEVLEIQSDDIEPPPAFGAKIHADFIQGMGKIDGDFVILLSVAKLLSDASLGLMEEVERLVESAA